MESVTNYVYLITALRRSIFINQSFVNKTTLISSVFCFKDSGAAIGGAVAGLIVFAILINVVAV